MDRIPIPVRVISKSQVEAILTPADVIDTVEDTFRAMGEGGIFHPVKEPMWMDEPGGNMLLAMPAHIRTSGVVGVKWVNLYTHQVPGLPASYGNVLLLSRQDNAQPYAIIEATPITTMRTAGGHAVVAAKYLARKDSSILTVVGCGEEALSGVRGFLTAFPGLKELRLCDLRPEAMARLAEEFKDRLEVKCIPNAQDAVPGTDMLLMVTTARKPVVKFEWLPKGCFVAGLYSFNDLDPACSTKADKWILGSKDTDYHQIINGPGMQVHGLSLEQVYADMGEIVTGKLPARENDDEIIVYTHMGMGALDVAVGDLIYRRAVEQGIGTMIDLA